MENGELSMKIACISAFKWFITETQLSAIVV
jgi:hypothetical protein